ncbi:MAG: hypothetical protein ACI9AR_000477 [Flavobacteriaceae bacterium]|jgi:hypothetical protein
MEYDISDKEIQELITALGGKEGVQNLLTGKTKIVVTTEFDHFGHDLLIGKGVLVTPPDYNPDTWLDVFKEKTLKTTCLYNLNLRSRKFLKPTDVPQPNRDYRVIALPVKNKVMLEVCRDYMKTIPGIKFFGIHGITLLQAQQPDLFPFSRYISSPDLKDNMKDNEMLNMPYILNLPDREWIFDFYSSELGFDDEVVLFFFYDSRVS